MKKKILVIVLAVICLVLLGGVIFQSWSLFYSSNIESEGCERLVYNGNPNEKVNIVFFKRGVEKQSLNNYVDYFLSVSPFSFNKDKFNFFYVDYEPACELENSALLCYSKDLLKESSVCPNDFIVVVSDEKRYVRSSAYMNVMSINSALPLSVFTHEFGHVFANLADEYVPARIPLGAKNCVKECEDFPEGSECFEGCSKANYLRSTQSSVMRSLNNEAYGELNEQIIGDGLR
jgi:hypothetical protein